MKKLLICFFGFSLFLNAQSVYLPATHQVYHFLDRMEARHVITDYRDVVKPLTRESIARFLIQIDTTIVQLTEVDQEQLFFFKEEFFQELENIGYENLIEERWHLYQYKSDPGNFNVDLIGGYTYRWRADGKKTNVTSNGLSAYGYLGSHVGLFFYFKDNREAGSYLSPTRPFSPIPAEVPSRNFIPRSFEYTSIEAQVNVDVGFVTLTVEKMPNEWGTGQHGNIILSNKPPSYPQVKLRAKLGKDIDFIYIHGWLYSDLIDSARSFQVPDIPGPVGFRRINRQKYIAAHIVEFTPWNGVDLSIGESEVYGSRNPELLYLIPMMFFKGAEHWMYDTDNSQFFVNADLNVIPNYNFYFSIFLDEFSTEDFYRTDKQRNQLAFTVGTRAYDLLFDNTEILVEYTRLNPWVYNHKYPDATFQSHSVDLGHWLGQNSDMFFARMLHQPMRSLQIGAQFESLRKGGKMATIFQYQLPTPEFLYSPRIKSQSFGLVGRYEPVRDFVVDITVLRSRYTDQNTSGAKDYAGKWDAFVGFRYNFD